MSISKEKVRVTTILERGVKEELVEEAQKDKRSLSSYIALVLDKHLQKLKAKKK